MQAAIFLAMIAIPTVVDTAAKEQFRASKEILFRAAAIVAGLALALYLTRRGAARAWLRRTPREALILPSVVFGWTVITTLTSSAKILSIDSAITVVCSIVFFFAALAVATQTKSLLALDVVFVGGVANAILVVLQEYRIWQPFNLEKSYAGHVASTGLMGNPNDVGTYLLGLAVAAVVGACMFRGVRRVAYASLTIVLIAGLVASGTRAALLAFAASLVFVAIAFRARSAVALAITIILGVAVTFAFVRFGRDAQYLVRMAHERRYDVIFSERLPAFLAAIDMTRDHPLTGVGPGAFKLRYMQYRMHLTARYPAEWTRGWPLNFRETHNDHLQTLAETGVPGYLILLACFVVFVERAHAARSSRQTEKDEFARALALPLAVAIAILMLAQFPLQLAASRAVMLYFAALCTGWRER